MVFQQNLNRYRVYSIPIIRRRPGKSVWKRLKGV